MAQNDGASEIGRVPDFLQGGGEMGALMRSMDWSQTPIGPVESWPQSLRTAVSIVLASGYPMLILWGPEYVQFYNDAYRPVLGATKHPNALGQRGRECWPEIWDMIGPMFDRVTSQGEAIWSEDLLFLLDRNGYLEETFFTFSYSPIRDETGGVGGVLVTCVETTERVLGERRLSILRELAARAGAAKSAEDACREATETLARDPADIPFAFIYLLDSAGVRAELLGATGLEPGMPASPLTISLQETEEQSGIWMLSRVAHTGKIEQIDDLTERFGPLPGGPWPESPHSALVLPLTTPGQERRAGCLVAGISPRRALDDDYRGFLDLVAGQIATAITSARAYEEERKRAEMLAELDRAKTTFFSNVSHEFRTPLTLMIGPLEDALKDSERFPSEDRELIEVAHRNSLRLLKLVNTLLDFSRIEAGRIRASYEPTNLAALTEDLASVFRSAIERAGMTLIINCPPLPEPVYVDRDMWEKVVLNLLSNAFKFTFEGRIEVGLREGGDRVEFSVRDTGIGIPEHEIPRLFERFHRVEGARGRTHEGTGIGLALVQELARLHGGSVSVESVYGQGSTFTLSLPFGYAHLPAECVGRTPNLASTALGAGLYVEEALRWLPEAGREGAGLQSESRAEARGREVGPAAFQSASPASPQPSPFILLADDNADMRDYVRRLLGEKYEVKAVPDGAEALKIARERRPDLILADIMMPRLDGFSLLRELRADPRLSVVPVVMLSARAGEESRIEGLEAGADDYLIKPFSARELLARVSTRVELSRLRMRLQQERESLTTLFAQTPIPIAILRGPELIFDMANEAYLRVVAGREILGKPVLEAMPELKGQGFDQLLQTVMQTGSPYVGHETPARLDRQGAGEVEETYWTFIYAPLQDDTGQTNRVIVICNEVTQQVLARKRFEFLASLDYELAQLRDTDTIGETAVEKVAEHLGVTCCAVYEVDPTATFHEVIYEWRPGDGSHDETYRLEDFITPEFLAAYEAGQAASVNDVRTDDRTAHFADKNKGLDILAFAVAPYLSERHPRALLIVTSATPRVWREDEIQLLRDVVARLYPAIKRARIEREREQLLAGEQAARSEAEEANRIKDDFLAMVSHELRTPLNAILGWANLLHSSKLDASTASRALETIERNARAQNQIINDLLDVSRIISGNLRLDVREVSLASVIETAVETLRPAVSAKGIRLQQIIDPMAGPVAGDPDRLQQVIWNLLSNAVKFTPKGGRIQLRLERINSHVEITVSDNGQGIAPDFLPYVFERFRQQDARSNRKYGGLGLGLAIVRHLIELHGGSVRVDSPGQGEGSIFTIVLPIVAVRSISQGEQRIHPTASGKPVIADIPDLEGLRILLVDDEADARDLIATVLIQAGAEVRSAGSSAEAICLIEQWRPDVILSDIGMPGEDGYTFIRRVRQLLDGSEIPAAALTAYARIEDRLRALSAGFQIHIPKPIEPAELLTVVASLAKRLQ